MTGEGVSPPPPAAHRQGCLDAWPLALLGIGVAAATAHAVVATDQFLMPAYVVSNILHGVVFLVAAIMVIRRRATTAGFLTILAVAIVIRGIAWTAEPNLSTDAYRYVWDARIQAAGFDPYRYVPADPRLAELRDEAIYPNINQKERAVTIYPPAAQMAFRLAAKLGDGLEGVRRLGLAADALITAVLLMLLARLDLPRERIILYAWHPLPVWEFVVQSHIDVIATAVLAVGLLALAWGWRFAGGAVFAVATLVKYFPIVLVPALWRRWDAKAPLAFVATAVLLYLPFARGGDTVPLGFLKSHLDNEGYGSGWGFHVIWLLRDFGIANPHVEVYLALSAILLAGLAANALFNRGATEISWSGLLLLGSAFVWLTSPHYPWYFAFLVPLLAVTPHPAAIAMTLLAVVLYLPRPPGGISWTEIYLVVYWLPLLILVVSEFLRRRHHGRRIASIAKSADSDGTGNADTTARSPRAPE